MNPVAGAPPPIPPAQPYVPGSAALAVLGEPPAELRDLPPGVALAAVVLKRDAAGGTQLRLADGATLSVRSPIPLPPGQTVSIEVKRGDAGTAAVVLSLVQTQDSVRAALPAGASPDATAMHEPPSSPARAAAAATPAPAPPAVPSAAATFEPSPPLRAIVIAAPRAPEGRSSPERGARTPPAGTELLVRVASPPPAQPPSAAAIPDAVPTAGRGSSHAAGGSAPSAPAAAASPPIPPTSSPASPLSQAAPPLAQPEAARTAVAPQTPTATDVAARLPVPASSRSLPPAAQASASAAPMIVSAGERPPPATAPAPGALAREPVPQQSAAAARAPAPSPGATLGAPSPAPPDAPTSTSPPVLMAPQKSGPPSGNPPPASPEPNTRSLGSGVTARQIPAAPAPTSPPAETIALPAAAHGRERTQPAAEPGPRPPPPIPTAASGTAAERLPPAARAGDLTPPPREAEALPARVVARLPAGATVVDTPIGRLMLSLPAAYGSVPVGGSLALALVSGLRLAAGHGAALPGLADVTRLTELPSLRSAVDALLSDGERGARALAETPIPRTARQVVERLLVADAESARPDARAVLGERAAAELERTGRSDIVARLDRELAEAAKAASQPLADNWRLAMLPILDGNDPRLMRVFSRRRRKGGERREGDHRFVLELELSALGPVQVDGLLRRTGAPTGHLDIVVRTLAALPSELQAELAAGFARACEGAGLEGALLFQVPKALPHPFAAAETAGHRSVLA